uniref:ATP-dependent DNA helicase n=1 Tax=Panagrolaimus superbus TaxID=310955 RepID=A0A914ZDU6_9BILA
MNSPAVIICAPTVGIHVDHFYPLTGDRLDALRNQTKHCKLLIIDEVSQCSNELLAKISLRFQEVTGIDEPFGNVPTLLVGDFLQLPPVNAQFCFEILSASVIKKITDSGETSYDLWSALDIHYLELYINKRQFNDLVYADVLGRIRIGVLTDEDYDYLMQQVVSIEEGKEKDTCVQELYHDLAAIDPTSLMLYSNNQMVDNFNKRYLLTHFKSVLVSIPPIYVDIESDDNENNSDSDKLVKRKRIRPRVYQQAKYQLNRTQKYSAPKPKRMKYVATLCKTIHIAVGVRVMLVYNSDLKNRLVNGTIGTVVDLKYSKKDTTKIISVMVKFDNIKNVVPVRRIAITIKRDAEIIFKQFPLTLAFSTTIHKSQSISLSTAIISLEKVFAPGQAYVALSRLQSVTGLYLLNCPKEAFICNQKALVELDRLRLTAGLPPRQPTSTWKHGLKARRKSEFEIRHIVVPKRARRMSIPRQPPTSHESLGLLQLRNRGTDCFIIAAVNLINITAGLKLAILNDDEIDVNVMANVHLVEILNGGANHVIDLRNDFPLFRNIQNQESAGHALMLIMEQLSNDVKQCITFLSTKFTSCLCDNGNARQSLVNHRKTLLQLNARAHVVNTLNTMVENYVREAPDVPCASNVIYSSK